MKKLASLLAVLAITIASAAAADSKYFTKVIHESDNGYSITLTSDLVMKITNFVQAGAGDTPATVAVYQGATGINVLAAGVGFVGREPHEDTYIAGPAYVNIAPMPGATLFLTFQLLRN
jgi:hypothetical protein